MAIEDLAIRHRKTETEEATDPVGAEEGAVHLREIGYAAFRPP